MLPVIPFFGLEIPSYTLMLAAGFTAGLFTALRRRSVYHLRTEVIVAACFIAGIGALLGGKLFYVLQGLPEFLQYAGTQGISFLDYFNRAGLVFYGGMAGTLFFLFLSAVLLHEPHWAVFDTLLPALPLAQAFGRVGCFLVGCCYGMPSAFGILMNPEGLAPADEPRLPVQLYEAAGTLLLFFILYRLNARKQPHGCLLGIYLLFYGVLRFVLEFLRGDEVRGFVGSLSVSQTVSLGVIAAGFLLLVYARQSRQTQPLSGHL